MAHTWVFINHLIFGSASKLMYSGWGFKRNERGIDTIPTLKEHMT